jgi:hypothetical protein
MRSRNHKLFDAKWGVESWLLGKNGEASLPSNIPKGEVPPIFRDWEYSNVKQSHAHEVIQTATSIIPSCNVLQNNDQQ